MIFALRPGGRFHPGLVRSPRVDDVTVGKTHCRGTGERRIHVEPLGGVALVPSRQGAIPVWRELRRGGRMNENDESDDESDDDDDRMIRL